MKIYVCFSFDRLLLVVKIRSSLQRQALKPGQLVQCSTCLLAKILADCQVHIRQVASKACQTLVQKIRGVLRWRWVGFLLCTEKGLCSSCTGRTLCLIRQECHGRYGILKD